MALPDAARGRDPTEVAAAPCSKRNNKYHLLFLLLRGAEKVHRREPFIERVE